MKLKEEEIKEHAIKFAEYVNNDIVFDDFIFMSKEHQEEIYKEYLKSKK
tara:strand:+ start:1061 stop:1207 length:147 start_codon:yes stop_codon:yes gene_type:complete